MNIVLDESGDAVGDWKTGVMKIADGAEIPNKEKVSKGRYDTKDAEDEKKAENPWRPSGGDGAAA